MDLRFFPEILKMSSVTLVFKSKNKFNVKNYRSISILRAKQLELLILQNIQLPVNNILIDKKFVFRPQCSAVSKIIVFKSSILKVFEERSWVDVIFTDFVKEFDRVDHNNLMDILNKSEFGGHILSWLKPCL